MVEKTKINRGDFLSNALEGIMGWGWEEPNISRAFLLVVRATEGIDEDYWDDGEN